MKLLLTEVGITPPTIHGALERLLGKPVGEATAPPTVPRDVWAPR